MRSLFVVLQWWVVALVQSADDQGQDARKKIANLWECKVEEKDPYAALIGPYCIVICILLLFQILMITIVTLCFYRVRTIQKKLHDIGYKKRHKGKSFFRKFDAGTEFDPSNMSNLSALTAGTTGVGSTTAGMDSAAQSTFGGGTTYKDSKRNKR